MLSEDEIMPDSQDNHTRPIGVLVTIREIHGTVLKIDEKLDQEVSKLKEEIATVRAQLAALWVIHGIVVTTIVFLLQKGLNNG